MKKSLMTLTLFLLALTTFAGTFDLGIKAGYNTAKLTTDLSTFTADQQGGYNFGAFGRFGGKRLYFNPEFLYVVNNGGFTVGTATNAIKMKSIQIPTLLGLNLLNLKVLKLNLFTGPAISFSSGYETDKPLSVNVSNSSWDYQLGAGIDILIFTFDVRYQWGISDKFTATDPTASFTSKVNAFRVSIGIKLL
jgi:hypothetical protein